jgi:exonuclease III
LASSSPKRGDNYGTDKGQHQEKKHKVNQLRVLVINFQSVKNKRSELQVMIESSKPDIIIGTETWLNDRVNSSEVFPPELGYDVIRRDRQGDSHEGVFIAARSALSLNHLHTGKDTELVAGSINISPRKKAILTCLYRPPNRQDQDTTDKAIQDISELRRCHKNDTFILGGDFSLPDINWQNYSIQGSNTSKDMNNSFLKMSADLNLQQMVNLPTRGDSILDLLFTSHPGQMARCKTIPPLGNSDHDVVLLDFASHIHIPKPKRRVIYLWKKANINGIENHFAYKLDTFSNTNSLKSTACGFM